MASANIGDRVFAISHADDTSVFVFGEGEYVGELVPSAEVPGLMSEALRKINRPNHTIRLDSGEIVLGAECWWGPVAQAEQVIKGRPTVIVSINARREEHRAAVAAQSAFEKDVNSAWGRLSAVFTDFAAALENTTGDTERAAMMREDIALLSDFLVITTGDEAESMAAMERRLGGEQNG